jgi:2-polyprenyl-3-methyl-5-hydroxy-6-metoxy-1,4-benzoquinol methylase
MGGDVLAPEPRYVLKAADRRSSHGRVLALLGAGRGRRLLDVGSAQGDFAAVLRDRGFLVTCVESDPGFAAAAREKGLDVVAADLEAPETLPAGPFDVVVLADVLEHVREPASALAQACRRLQRDGRVVVSIPNVAHWTVRLALLFGRFEYADRGILDRGHLRFFTRRTVRRLLAEAGLRVERLECTRAPFELKFPGRAHRLWLWIPRAVEAIGLFLRPPLFAYQFVALCAPSGAEDE